MKAKISINNTEQTTTFFDSQNNKCLFLDCSEKYVFVCSFFKKKNKVRTKCTKAKQTKDTANQLILQLKHHLTWLKTDFTKLNQLLASGGEGSILSNMICLAMIRTIKALFPDLKVGVTNSFNLRVYNNIPTVSILMIGKQKAKIVWSIKKTIVKTEIIIGRTLENILEKEKTIRPSEPFEWKLFLPDFLIQLTDSQIYSTIKNTTFNFSDNSLNIYWPTLLKNLKNKQS